ncbi:hypothetical protein [Entomobacter blattae]|uniref:Uncharacterized protein n=1 Tax=Entomobacter blattae TaxID=2762277 RepID=A0A7H1NRU7_9PROT|nr:hypothetical protein [Entomobacter blattae]QNT78507.1 hypothetical protein JGUZn3_12810 [Entomobacter blattae]
MVVFSRIGSKALFDIQNFKKGQKIFLKTCQFLTACQKEENIKEEDTTGSVGHKGMAARYRVI